MKSRLVASVALGAALVLTTTGCSMISPQATTIEYAAADGVNVHDAGPLEVRNALVVASDDGSTSVLVAAIVNNTDQPHTLDIELGEAGATTSTSVAVPARSVISLGGDDEPLALPGVMLLPGTTVPGYFVSGDSDGSLVSLPVLDDTLSYLTPVAP